MRLTIDFSADAAELLIVLGWLVNLLTFAPWQRDRRRLGK